MAAFAVAVIVLLASYWQTVQSLVWAWDHDGTYQYAFLIFPLSLWVAFNLRDQLQANLPAPSVWGLAAVGGLVFVWYAGHLLDVNLLQHFALVALFPALVLACWGWRALWALAFPLGYLVVFAVPWGNGLVGPLQDITAHFAVRALGVDRYPSAAQRPGNRHALGGVDGGGCMQRREILHRLQCTRLFVCLADVPALVEAVGVCGSRSRGADHRNGLRVYFTILIGEIGG